ncbi:MAG: BolA family transcriptional regulator [Alphaproteobacteria bacterium]|nr:BolA family transcriptional regulator [Alphaproteobacteria bacterium]
MGHGASDGVALTSVEARIRAKLAAAFRPLHLVLENQSQRHAGHAGAEEALRHAAMVSERTSDSGTSGAKIRETHFALTMVAESFSGQTRLARQRAVLAVLAEELRGPVHALSLDLRSPTESPSASAPDRAS